VLEEKEFISIGSDDMVEYHEDKFKTTKENQWKSYSEKSTSSKKEEPLMVVLAKVTAWLEKSNTSLLPKKGNGLKKSLYQLCAIKLQINPADVFAHLTSLGYLQELSDDSLVYSFP